MTQRRTYHTATPRYPPTEARPTLPVAYATPSARRRAEPATAPPHFAEAHTAQRRQAAGGRPATIGGISSEAAPARIGRAAPKPPPRGRARKPKRRPTRPTTGSTFSQAGRRREIRTDGSAPAPVARQKAAGCRVTTPRGGTTGTGEAGRRERERAPVAETGAARRRRVCVAKRCATLRRRPALEPCSTAAPPQARATAKREAATICEAATARRGRGATTTRRT